MAGIREQAASPLPGLGRWYGRHRGGLLGPSRLVLLEPCGSLRAHLVWTRVWEGFRVEEAIGDGEAGHSGGSVVLEGPARMMPDVSHHELARSPSSSHGDECSQLRDVRDAVASSEKGSTWRRSQGPQGAQVLRCSLQSSQDAP